MDAAIDLPQPLPDGNVGFLLSEVEARRIGARRARRR
jgi:hypothetical protein